MEAVGSGQFHVHTHAVCKIPNFFNNSSIRSWYSFCVDVTTKMIFIPKEIKSFIHKFHGVGGIF